MPTAPLLDIMMLAPSGIDQDMAQVLVRNLDDQVVERLRQRAKAEGKSLEQALRDLLTEAARPDREEILAEMDRIRAMTPAAPQTDSAELIREDRDRGWG
ncbi:MAG TPA: ribbon-helix-helix protein, CopG family [Geminicoccaceae bacterium]